MSTIKDSNDEDRMPSDRSSAMERRLLRFEPQAGLEAGLEAGLALQRVADSVLGDGAFMASALRLKAQRRNFERASVHDRAGKVCQPDSS
jgi:hypothetical protein